MTVTEPIFTKLMLAELLSVKNPSREFEQNPRCSFVTESRLQTDK